MYERKCVSQNVDEHQSKELKGRLEHSLPHRSTSEPPLLVHTRIRLADRCVGWSVLWPVELAFCELDSSRNANRIQPSITNQSRVSTLIRERRREREIWIRVMVDDSWGIYLTSSFFCCGAWSVGCVSPSQSFLSLSESDREEACGSLFNFSS